MPNKDKSPTVKPKKAPSQSEPVPEERVKTMRLSGVRRAAILKALADPRRYELLERIAKASCPLGCAQARTALPISAATLSHHIKELETAGLIHIRREGKFHYMTLRAGVLEALATTLAALEQGPCGPR
jgi:ArsR family transcriptional regulator